MQRARDITKAQEREREKGERRTRRKANKEKGEQGERAPRKVRRAAAAAWREKSCQLGGREAGTYRQRAGRRITRLGIHASPISAIN